VTGVTRGWRDLGLQINGPLAPELAASFDDMFARADFQTQTVHPPPQTACGASECGAGR